MKKFSIGFNVGGTGETKSLSNSDANRIRTTPKKSLVDIYFPQRNMTLSYYNDKFDLQEGDIVYVDGKLEGMRGRVVSVNYSFKIKLSYYKRVIAVADTSVSGDFYFAGSHVVCFDRDSLNYDKVLTWFKAPAAEDEEYVSGAADQGFAIENLNSVVSPEIASRGEEYYMDNKVIYLSLDNTHGKAIVEGREIYEIEFDYKDGIVHDLICSCYCNYNCKHVYAAMLQLQETLVFINDNYSDVYDDYFAAMFKGAFFTFTIDKTKVGKITL